MSAQTKITSPLFFVLVALLMIAIAWVSRPESSHNEMGNHITAAQARKLAVRFMEIRTKSPGKVGVNYVNYEDQEWRIGATLLPSGPARLAIMTVDDWGNVTRYVPAME